jgi:hypothetical protein
MAKATGMEFRHHNKVTEYPSSATVTQVTSGATDTCVLTHPIVLVNSNDNAVALALPDGEKGQMLTIISADANDIAVTPATSTLFATVVLAIVGDQCTLQYVDDTVGWMIVGLISVIVNTSPAFTQ